jgi:hypothetical protein
LNTILKNIIRFTCCLLLVFGCLEDETEDFTSENNYPILPQDTTDTDNTGDDDEDPNDDVNQGPRVCGDSIFTVTRSQKFIDLFTRFGGGWTGGDATYSIPLPDGKTLWIFGDTFLGVVNPDRSRPPVGLARNTFVVQDGETLTTFVQPDESAFINPENPSWWYWPTDGTVHNDTLQVMLSAFRSTNTGGPFSFAYTRIDLAQFTLPDLQLISIEPRFEEPNTAYGSCVVEDENYIYIYGARFESTGKFGHLARSPGGDLRNEWEYYNGSEWTTDPNESVGVVNNVSEQFAVFKSNGRYYLVTSNFQLGPEIYLFDSPAPEGPWQQRGTIYCTPETVGNRWTYNAFVHPQFTENGEILISYNVNSFEFFELYDNADYYRPYFIRVGNWQ